MRHSTREAVTVWVIILGAVIVVSLLGFLGYRHHQQCLDNGGHWVKTNCHIVHGEDCTTTTYWDKGYSTTSCMPHDYSACDDVCVGERAEAE